MMLVILERMDELVAGWGPKDRRSLFARAYRSMSANMFSAIDSDEFADSVWVNHLLSSFAAYYFDAVAAVEGPPGVCPEVWNVAFSAASDDRIHPLRVLFLGINAHINYDLALCVADVMNDWNELDPAHRDARRSDYDKVNRIVSRTIDAVQTDTVAPVSPTMDLLDDLLGPIDEWLFTAMIINWRSDTWGDAQLLLASADDRVGEVRARIESEALLIADRIIHIGPD